LKWLQKKKVKKPFRVWMEKMLKAETCLFLLQNQKLIAVAVVLVAETVAAAATDGSLT
jgi:hypothetical protein